MSEPVIRPIDDDDAWADLRAQWSLQPDITYLNHGSFGPSPMPVRNAYHQWIDTLENQPMDFLFRRLEPEIAKSTERLAQHVGTTADNLAMIDNATAAMNVVAASVSLSAGDEVLLTDHEYGAVRRIWERVCEKTGASLVDAVIPLPIESKEHVLDAFRAKLTEKTRLVVFSHVTSATALVLPVQEICQLVREHGAIVCIDGPHGLVQTPLDIEALDCDFYTASCHKWLCAPFGTGFLYANPRQHKNIEPAVLSWGRLDPNKPERWSHEYIWCGTRDPSAYLSVSTAIEFMESVGLNAFRERTHHLAQYGAALVSDVVGLPPVANSEWFASMFLVELPQGDAWRLRDAIWHQYGIEVHIIPWHDRRFARISCHLYNTRADVEKLAEALAQLL